MGFERNHNLNSDKILRHKDLAFEKRRDPQKCSASLNDPLLKRGARLSSVSTQWMGLAARICFKALKKWAGAVGFVNIGLVVNARGKMCLVHDEPFEATPLWVGYHTDKRQLEIIFDTGGTYPIVWEATDEMNAYLLKINKILIIRMENKKPVEGYDTSFLRLKGGRTID